MPEHLRRVRVKPYAVGCAVRSKRRERALDLAILAPFAGSALREHAVDLVIIFASLFKAGIAL